MNAEKGKRRTVLLVTGGAVILLAIAAVLIFAVFKTGNTETYKVKRLVGITLPTKTLSRSCEPPESAMWKHELENKGYAVDLQFSDSKQDVQNSQIECQIKKGCDILIINPVDGGGLGGVLKKAKEAGIPVIVCNKLPMNTDKCDYYVTFDNYTAGRLQGQYIIDALGINAGAKGPFTLECFAGDPGDSDSACYFDGAMEALRPYIDSGILVVRSGQTSREAMMITNMLPGTRDRMDNLLTAFYTDKNIDAILSPGDSISQGIVISLKNHGYGTKDKPFPVLTGMGCDKAGIGRIIRGEQSMSVFRDDRALALKASAIAEAILTGKEVPVNAVYNNGVIDILSYNCELICVDAENWKEVLVDSGYYTETDIPKY